MLRLLPFAFFVLLVIGYSSSSCRAECTPSFPYKDGWLGGDVAYSVPLDAQHSVWFFGDTFTSESTATTRRGSRMVANSIAISTCRNADFDIHYHVARLKSGAPRAFFDSPTNAYRYWPMDGFVYEGRLYVSLYQVVTKPEGGPFGFELRGVTLARIANPGDDPQHWSIKYLDLASDGVVFPGVAAIVSPPWVYLFAVLADDAHPEHPMILTRLAIKHLDAPSSAIEYLAKDGSWKPGLNWHDARLVIDRGQTEMSIRYHPEIREWIAVQQRPGIGTGIGVRTAYHLEGPWSSFQSEYSIPEALNTRDNKTFCYAAKEHIEFAREDNLVVSYVCNSSDFAKLTGDTSLYRPRVVRIPFPH